MQVYSQHLEFIRPLSTGPEAEVWLARDLLGNSPCVFRGRRSAPVGSVDDLVQQVRLLRLLEESGFVGAEDVVCNEGRPAGFTARLVESCPLREVAQGFGERQLIEVLSMLCQSMAYLHSLDFLHGDLKPDNILVEVQSEKVRPLLTDLGLAVRRGAQFTTEVRGSHGYMAPEVLEGLTLTETTDVYSFGMILSELAGTCSQEVVSGNLADLGRACADQSPAKRPQTFWEVQSRLNAALGSSRRADDGSELYPPLRQAGLGLRLRAIERVFAPAVGRGPQICLIRGPSGVGKSKLIREYCLMKQLEGGHTLRVSGAESGAALNANLDGWIRRTAQFGAGEKSRPVQWVLAETDADCFLDTGDLEDLRAIAAAHALRIIVECRHAADSHRSSSVEMVRVGPLSVRECIASASHLTDRPTLSIANGESLRVATGGIPRLMRHYLKSWLPSGCRGQPTEPLNFDRLDPSTVAYWRRKFRALHGESPAVLAHAALFHHAFLPSWLPPPAGGLLESIPVLEGLVHTGWLDRIDGEIGSRRYRFASRSARNSVRLLMGPQWLKATALRILNQEERGARLEEHPYELQEMRRLAGIEVRTPTPAILAGDAKTLVDWKMALRAALRHYRALAPDSGDRRIRVARAISDGFARLGCSRRQIRWAGIALREAQRQSARTVPSLDEARWRCNLLDIAGDLLQKEQYLQEMIESLPPTGHAHLHGFLLSELGTLFLTRSDFKRAQSACHQAHHLLKPNAPTSEEFARNLNRLGLILLYSGADQAAKRYLDQSRQASVQNGWDEVRWRCQANLGLVARAMGDPWTARDHLRRAADHYRLAQDTPTYLQALSNQVPCYVDLGQGFAALRAARLAVALAEIVADPVRSGYAHDLHGWVLTMQGHLRQARASLETAIRIRLRNGNTIGAARVQLNLTRLFLVAADNSKAEDACRAALAVFTREGDLEGCWEGNRLLARAAIARDAYDDAEELLRLVPLEHPRLSRRDKIETMLAWFALSLWAGDITRAQELADRLHENPMVEHVHPLRCEMGRLLGQLLMAKHEYDQSLEILGRTATECRLSGRVDQSIETLVVMSLLAREMGNWRVAVRYLKSAESILNRIRGELQ